MGETKSFNKQQQDNMVSKKSSVLVSKKLLLVLLTLIFSLSIIGLSYYLYSKATTKEEEVVITATTLKEKEIIDKISQTTDPVEKSALYMSLSAEQQLNGNNQTALDSAQKALELNASASAYAVLGAKMAVEKQYDKAAEYFSKAAELSPKTELSERSDYAYYTKQANKYKEMTNE